jgi:hypothetical protein
MQTSTISLTFDKAEVNPVMLEQALHQLFDLLKIEILESEVTNVTPEENAQVFGD